MAEELIIGQGTKEEKYKTLIPQIKALVSGEPNVVANTANIAAALKDTFGFLWVGFYFVEGKEFVLGPFQGPIACTRIQIGKGVSGTAWQEKRTLLVDDVDAFPGHIACSSESRSEIVVPILKNDTVVGVLDADSDKLSDFDKTDQKYLEELCAFVSDLF